MRLHVMYYFIYTNVVFSLNNDCSNESDSFFKSKRSKRQSSSIGDESTLPYEVKSSALPTNPDSSINTRYMPTLGNGYIGTTVYEYKLYLNSIFNGLGGNSHRAEIPAIVMTRINLTTPEYERKATRKFVFNAIEGYFMETIRSDFAIIEHKTYVHQKYIRLLVTDIFITFNTANTGGGTLSLTFPKLESPDFKFDTPIAYLGNWQVKGRTLVAEKGEQPQDVYIFYQLLPNQISVSGSNRVANYTWIMSVDKQEGTARTEFDKAQQILQTGMTSNYDFFQEHVRAWNQSWASGYVELIGSKTTLLPKAAWMAQAYILNSLPSETPYWPPSFSEIYYGCGRTSLGKGSLGKNYQGHVMWDNEMHILPAILPFHPYLAKQMLRYRSKMGKTATENAKLVGSDGYLFPFESGYSGAEVSPTECPGNDSLCYQRRIYVSAGVAHALRQYNSMTRDRDFMKNPEYAGCTLSKRIADFLASRCVYNAKLGRYDILDITGPDDFHPRINNNAYTIAAVSLAIHYARYYSCICQNNERQEVPDEYIMKALYLNIPFDNLKRVHYQYQGFDPAKDIPISQADAILLNFPLNWNYSIDIMRNDLNMYETMVGDKTPAMTWSWYAVGYKWTKEYQKMNSYFFKSYSDYIQQPFRIWTEYAESAGQQEGVSNFLPGMGAFIQSLIYGFGGFRIRPDRLEIHNPMPPTDVNIMKLNNFQYLGSNLTFTIEAKKVTIFVVAAGTAFPLVLRRNVTGAGEESLNTGATVVISPSEEGFFIYTTVSEPCEHPRDYIYMPWGYSPQLSSNSPTNCHSFIILVTLIVFYASRL